MKPETTDRADPRAAGLDPGWWVRALSAAELADGAAARPAPAWRAFAQRAVADAGAAARPLRLESWQEAFAAPLSPFLDTAHEQLLNGVEPAARRIADLESVGRSLRAPLAARLARIAVRTLVTELDAARNAGTLEGADERERFCDFLRRLCTPAALCTLLGRYPVLARLLADAAGSAADAAADLLNRTAADRAQLVGALLGDGDPGPVAALEPGLGDLHRRGRSVTLVRFADGRAVVYKPRDLQAHAKFATVIAWLNERVPHCDLRPARVLLRPGYGWMEFVHAAPLRRAEDARRFYLREGALLAVLYALCGTDMHSENVIACGDQPVLIDVETLFHPALPAARLVTADPADEALAGSVLASALLPHLTIGEGGVLDLSGMGGDPSASCPDEVLDWDPPASDRSRLVRRAVPYPGSRNRPHFAGRPAEPSEHEAEILDGFRLGYDAIARGRAQFSRLLEGCAGIETRVVARPTRGYARLLEESTHPDFLRDARARDQALDALDDAAPRHPLYSRLAPHERAALWAGDVPLFCARPGSRDVSACDGRRLPGVLDRSGLSRALDRVAAMDEVDRGGQEWVVRASLASRRRAEPHRGTRPRAAAGSPVAAQPGRLLAAAAALADRIVARGATWDGGPEHGRINWLGLQLVDESRWMVLPMGAGLADGYLGVALFLAELARLTGIARYAQVARRAVGPVPRLLAALSDRPQLLAAVGCGGGQGLGGMSYALARLSNLLGDARLAEWAETSVRLAAQAAPLSDEPGWSNGLAGCLAAMGAVHEELGSAAADELAAACALRLSALVEQAADGAPAAGAARSPMPASAGFAEGAAGIGWALARFAAHAGDPRFERAARWALTWAGRQADAKSAARDAAARDEYGWCRGAAGLLLARARLAGYGGDDGRAEIGRAVSALADLPALEDLSLCHGESGVAEALTVLVAADPGHAALRTRLRRAGLVMDAIRRHGPACGTPGAVPTPGLRHGLAGIGYGLLRLGFAESVPSVLLLEPAA